MPNIYRPNCDLTDLDRVMFYVPKRNNPHADNHIDRNKQARKDYAKSTNRNTRSPRNNPTSYLYEDTN